jgi:hypothetical protein
MSDYDKVKSLLKGGPSRPTLFRIRFSTPGGITLATSLNVRELNDYSEYLCKEAVLPGSNIVSVPVKGQSRIGVFHEQPIGRIYNEDLTLTFVERNDYFIHNFFMRWLDKVTPGGRQTRGGASNIHVGYYDEISARLEIIKEEQGKKRNPSANGGKESALVDRVRYTIHGVYPTDVASIPLSTDAVDSYVQTIIKFQYETFYIDYGTGEFGDVISALGL